MHEVLSVSSFLDDDGKKARGRCKLHKQGLGFSQGVSFVPSGFVPLGLGP